MASEFASWLRVLDSDKSSDDQLCEAARWFSVQQDPMAVEPLFRRLTTHADAPHVREELVYGLGFLKPIEHAPYLLSLLFSPVEPIGVKQAAISALGWMRSQQAVVPLLKTLKSRDDRLVYALVGALGNIGDAQAVDVLIEMLQYDDFLVKQAAAEALGKIGHPSRKAIPGLQELARHGTDAQRRIAMEAITKIEGEP